MQISIDRLSAVLTAILSDRYGKKITVKVK